MRPAGGRERCDHPRLTVLKAALLRLRQVFHDPLCPFIAPLQPPFIICPAIRQQLRQAVER